MYGELFIPPVYEGRNLKTGRYMKGHIPANKGKKWSEYLSKRTQRRCAKGWKNLDLYRNKNGRSVNAGRRRRQVVAVMDDGSFRVFPFILAAAEYVGGKRENVGRCCRLNGKRTANTDHRYKGVRFYYESENVWLSKIKGK